MSSKSRPLNQLIKNLDLLARNQPELAHLLSTLPGNHVEVFPSASGIPTARLLRGSSAVPLHSRYDPLKEARGSLMKLDLAGADYFVLLGFGLGYLLEAVIEKSPNPANRYFIIESDLEILRAAMAARDLQGLLSLPHLHLAWPPSGMELAEQWRRFFDPAGAQKSVFVTHAPSAALAPELFKAAVEVIQSETFQIYTDINTLVVQSRAFLQNFVKNLSFAIYSPGIASFAGHFRETPAVIVSAGPSLDKNIQDLHGYEEGCLVLSTDTALKPLLASGLEPHFILTGDPNYANFLHLKGAAVSTALLVAEATAYPAVFAKFAGHTICCTYENSALGCLSDLLTGKGTLRAWGTVASMALDFAFRLGCNPVIFIGQDFAHTDGRIYCTGLHFDSEWFSGNIDADEWQKRWEALRHGKKTVIREDVFGRPVETTDKLAAYWNWIVKEIRNHPEVRFINATEGGILCEGVEIMSLREALYRFARDDRQLQSRLRSIYQDAARKKPTQPSTILEFLLAESKMAADVLERGIQSCLQASPTAGPSLMLMLDNIKESIYLSAPRIAKILDCFNQMGNVTFLRNRAGLGRDSSDQKIRSLYREYFETVRQALNEITPALDEIRNTLARQSN